MLTIKKLFKYLKTDYRWQDLIPLDLQFNHDKLLVITGPNASGKSVLRRIIHGNAKKHKVDAIAVSPEFKQYGGIDTAFVYGDESYEASGAIACHACQGSISTSRKRDVPHVVILDEPDMGLSDNCAAGIGEEIAEFIQDPPELLLFYSLITHRRALLQPLLHASHIRVGGDNLTLKQVFEEPITPIRPATLQDQAHDLFRKVSARIKLK